MLQHQPSDVLRAESTGRDSEEEGWWDEDVMFSCLMDQALPGERPEISPK